MTTRRLDRWQMWIAVVTLLQLAAGTTYVTVRAQRRVDAAAAAIEQAREIQHQSSDLEALKARMTAFEVLNIGPRLAVLEDVKNRQEKLEFLAYGQVLSIAGVLIIGVLQLKQTQRNRKEPD